MLMHLAQSAILCCSLLPFLHGHLSNAKVLTFVGQGNSLLPQDEAFFLRPQVLVQPAQQAFLREFVENVGTRAKKKGNDGGGKRKKCLPPNPTILKNCIRPQMQLLLGAVLVMLITQHSKHQSNQVCFVYGASQIWSDLICGRRLQMLWSDIYLNHVCAKVYQI